MVAYGSQYSILLWWFLSIRKYSLQAISTDGTMMQHIYFKFYIPTAYLGKPLENNYNVNKEKI